MSFEKRSTQHYVMKCTDPLDPTETTDTLHKRGIKYSLDSDAVVWIQKMIGKMKYLIAAALPYLGDYRIVILWWKFTIRLLCIKEDATR